MKEDIEIFPNISKILLFIVLCIILVIPFYMWPADFITIDNITLESIILILGVLLFSYGIVHFSILLIRFNKPLLVISTDKIIINHLFKKNKIIYFENVKKFRQMDQTHRGFKSNRLILIEMKTPSEKYRNSIYYKIYSNFFSSEIVNSEFTIQTNFLNIDSKKLLKMLNNKIKTE